MKLETFPKTVFLTGATGVLGGSILKDLLQSTSSRIYCLARGKDLVHCQERVRSFLRVYDANGALESAFLSRVIVLWGDVTQDRLGLSKATYAELQSHTDITIHAAANTSLLLKYKRLEPINVQGTGRVIEFCLGTVEKSLSYVSTYTVMGDKTFDNSVRFQETDYDLGQGFKYMNYQRSKFRAEAMVRAAQGRGLKWRIFRPGQIYGDSTTGAYPHSETQVTGLFYDLFKTAMDTRVMPESYIHYDVVPVDYVSRGIVALSAGVENFFDVYHLTNPDAKTFSQVMGLLREIGYHIDLLPEEIYKQRLRRGEITKNGEPYTSTILKAFNLWYFISEISFYVSAMTDCEYTRSKLETLGVTCAPINRKLIETYVHAGIRGGYFPSPSHSDNHNATRAPVDFSANLFSAEGCPT
ncbi:MAG: NAD-dependent epimerase/dehydratase family protein [Burkholderiaceae bacterium]|nr:MAG: NAD-dependent epimerase/dehydratase family protein [Burkholderiaceae bacterium]